jgi:hypothetical protein
VYLKEGEIMEREQYGVRSCNITKEMLSWPPDQTITDRICKEQFINSTSRGNAKEVIFLLEKDFTAFLGVLSLVVKRYHFLLPTYCLMKNHDHLLIKNP